MAQASSSDDRLPQPTKQPSKTNIFRKMSSANTQLLPLFPHGGPGDIVPCGAQLRGGRDHGYFLHYNSVDEVNVAFGVVGGRLRTGQVRVGPHTHGVQGPSAEDPDELLLVTITQRQAESGDQSEAMIFPCGHCQSEVYRHDFDASHAAGSNVDTRFPVLATVEGCAAAVAVYNGSDAVRTCSGCGTVNAPYPADVWGWEDNVRQTEASRRARAALDQEVLAAR